MQVNQSGLICRHIPRLLGFITLKMFSSQCSDPSELLDLAGKQHLDKPGLKEICPLMLYQLDSGNCQHLPHNEKPIRLDSKTNETNKKPTTYEGNRSCTITWSNDVNVFYLLHFSSMGIWISLCHDHKLLFVSWCFRSSYDGEGFLFETAYCADWSCSWFTIG